MTEQKLFKGYHGEWNLGSPGGWEYQRMIQGIYLPAWQEIKKLTKLPVTIDLEHPYFSPSLKFADILIEHSRLQSQKKATVIAIMAEEETLDDVVENQRFADYLNSLPEVSSMLIGPRELEFKNSKLLVNGQEVTTIFMDFNTTVLIKLKEKHSIEPIIEAIKQGIIVNPRSMEAINTKSLFEIIGTEYKDKLSNTTVSYTPWTRKFYQRETTGPQGEEIKDLVAWAREHWQEIVLKPELGWSGKGIIICPKEKDIEANIEKALTDKTYGNYIIQEFVPLSIWTESMPEIDPTKEQAVLVDRQTDFRCVISNKGLVGFLARFGGYPTNVGSGGGVQALALVTSNHSPAEATKIINEAILKLDFAVLQKIQAGIDKRATALKFIYLNGPIPIGLRPRVFSPAQAEALKTYAENIYQDTLILEEAWREGRLDHIISLSEEENKIARLYARTKNSPAILASDGLFSFA